MKITHFRRFLILLAWVGVLPFTLGAGERPEIGMGVEAPAYCKLLGAVFVETVPSFADYRVFNEETESFADMLVYKETTRSFASDPGCWYFTDVKAFADFSIAWVPIKSSADFSVNFTTYRSRAGCL